eukprot:TRINITY_DN10736_c0_g2_i1.p1 TRINITY_DN10736_c0_g2~~TRINITY_DN10736_c0_g2_i1.p1  ORF type:complete len:1101 (+),score=226.83 TRINITY_DN10736_c0_g2_i1:168-3470(+)
MLAACLLVAVSSLSCGQPITDVLEKDLIHTTQVRLQPAADGRMMAHVDIKEGATLVLNLAVVPAPVTADFKIEYRSRDGLETVQGIEDVDFYRGSVQDEADSNVHLIHHKGVVRGMLTIGADTYHVEPDTNADNSHQLYHNTLVRRSADPKKGCGVDASRRLHDIPTALAPPPTTSSNRARRGYRGDPERSVCNMVVIVDHLFFASPGNSSRDTTRMLILSLVSNAARIFGTTNFTQGIGTNVLIHASKIVIYETEDAPGNVFNSSIDYDLALLDLVYGLDEEPACLRHLVTNRVFNDSNVLGLGNIGGICTFFDPPASFQDGTEATSLAAAFTSWDNATQFPLQQTQNVFAHEIGHVFGAKHDNECDGYCSANPSECTGNAVNFDPADGHYLMNPTIGTDQPNNNVFSQCSIEAMSQEINNGTAGGACFTSPSLLTCGDGVVDPGEACDCGSRVDCSAIDPCCTTTCQLVGECTPANGPCCHANCTMRGFESVAELQALNTSETNGLECPGTPADECFRPLYCIKDPALAGACPSFNYPCADNATDAQLSTCQSQGFYFIQPFGTSCNQGFNTCNNRGCTTPIGMPDQVCKIRFTVVSGDALAQFELVPEVKTTRAPVLPGPTTITALIEDCDGNVVLATPPTDVVIRADRQRLLVLATLDGMISLADAMGLAGEQVVSVISVEPTKIVSNESVTVTPSPMIPLRVTSDQTAALVQDTANTVMVTAASAPTPITLNIANNQTQLALASATIDLVMPSITSTNTGPRIIGLPSGSTSSVALSNAFPPAQLSLIVTDTDLARPGSIEFVSIATNLLSSQQYASSFSRMLTSAERRSLCGSTMGRFATSTNQDTITFTIDYTPKSNTFGFQSVVCVWQVTVTDAAGATDTTALAVGVHSPSLPPTAELGLPTIRHVYTGVSDLVADSTQQIWVVFQDLNTTSPPNATVDFNGTVVLASQILTHGNVTFSAIFDVTVPNTTGAYAGVVTVMDTNDGGQAQQNISLNVVAERQRRAVIFPKIYLELSSVGGQFEVAASQASFKPTTTLPPTVAPKADESLSTLELAGIIVGSIVVVLTAIMLYLFCRTHNRRKTVPASDEIEMD